MNPFDVCQSVPQPWIPAMGIETGIEVAQHGLCQELQWARQWVWLEENPGAAFTWGAGALAWEKARGRVGVSRRWGSHTICPEGRPKGQGASGPALTLPPALLSVSLPSPLASTCLRRCN